MAPESTLSELGLRERKRIATRRAIQLAAVELASERGFDRVTIDEISHVANVSPRTFFNYFPSKESAIIGELPELPDEESIDRFVEAGPDEAILDGISLLLIAAIEVFIDAWNEHCEPFVWTKTTDEILEKALPKNRQTTSVTGH